MRDWGITIICLVIIVGLGLAARNVASTAWQSVVDYETPYTGHGREQLASGGRLAQRVVLIVLDGLRLDASRELPFLNELRARGADGIGVAQLPSLSNPGRAAMVTGANADIHGVTSNFGRRPVPVDSVLMLAKQAGLRTASAGGTFWHRAFSAHLTTFLRAAPEPHTANPADLLTAQDAACKEALEFVRNTPFDLMLLDATTGDTASHDFGPLSAASRDTYRRVDECLRQIVTTQPLPSTTFIIVSDHGHIEPGGHGGDEPEVTNVPIVLVGGPVRAGSRFNARHIDIAPTISVLLGLPLPVTSEGKPLLDVLNINPAVKKTLSWHHTVQQEKVTKMRRAVVGGTVNEGASLARRSRTQGSGIVVVGLLLLAFWLFFTVLRSATEWRAMLWAVLAYYGTYFALFTARGMAYSLSAVNREEYLQSYFLQAMIISGIALAVAAAVACFTARNGSSRVSASAALVITLTVAGQVLVIHWAEGLWMTSLLPNLDLLFKAYLDLIGLVAFIFAVWPAMLAGWGGGRLAQRIWPVPAHAAAAAAPAHAAGRGRR